jgi:hypothetical protein
MSSTSSSEIQLSIERELSHLKDSRVLAHIRGLLVRPLAATELPIWRVFKQEGDNYPGLPVTEEADWKSTWGVIEQLRSGDSVGRYSCGHSIKSVGDEPSRTPP